MSNLWVVPEELGEDLADTEYAYEACETASFILWSLSGRRFSGTNRTTEVYSTVPENSVTDTSWMFRAQTTQSALYKVFTRQARESAIALKGRPVQVVHTVRVGEGLEVLNPDDYWVTDHTTLRFKRPVAGNVEVTYEYGALPPAAGRMAARQLAQQFAKLWGGMEEDCELPDRVTSISRQGMSMTILDQQDFIDELRTGVYAVDLFLKATNPFKATRRSRVFSPDIARGVKTTPQPPKLPASPSDIVVVQSAGEGSVTIELDSIDQTLFEGGGWEPELILRSYGDKKAITMHEGVSVSDDRLTVTVDYFDAVAALGSKNPGVWDLYLNIDGRSTYIASGNLSVRL